MNREFKDAYSSVENEPVFRDFEPPQLDLREMMAVFWRRRWLFFGTVGFIVVTAVITVFQLTPRYDAQVAVMVAPRTQQIVDIEAVVSGLSGDTQAVESEIQVLRSRGLMKRVQAEMGLDGNAELNPSHPDNEGGLLSLLTNAPLLAAARGEISRDDLDSELRQQLVEAEIVEAMLDRLSVSSVGRSRVINVRFTSEDPRLAARIANAIADLYIAQQVELKAEATRDATDWLSDRLGVLKAEVEQAERAAETFRAEIATIDGRDQELITQQIFQTSAQIIRARADYETARVRLEHTEELLRLNGYEVVLEVIDPNLSVRYNENIVRLRQTEATLMAQYGPSHPVVKDLQARIDALSRQTSENMIASLRSAVQIEQARLASLEASLTALLDDAAEINQAMVELRSLDGEAIASRSLYETFLNRFKETEQTGLEQPDSWIVSRAELPTEPSYPKKSLLISIAFIGACCAGAMLVFVAEQLEGGFRTLEELEQVLGTSGLALIPTVSVGKGRQGPQDVAAEDPLSTYAEAHRSLHTALLLSGLKTDAGSAVLVSSALPGDGKSSLVMSLARVVAKSGKRVVVIDADLRHPRIHIGLDLPNVHGLTGYLDGKDNLEAVLQTDQASGAMVIAAGPHLDDPSDHLRRQRLADLVAGLRSEFDLVLIDSPPVIPVSDALILATLVDRTLVAAKWRETPQKAVRRTVDQLREAGAGIAGVVLTQADMARQGGYGHGSYGYRYGSAAGD